MHYLTTKRLIPTLILVGLSWNASIPVQALDRDLPLTLSISNNSVKSDSSSSFVARKVKSKKGKIYISPNGQIQVTLPSGWSKTTGLNERAELEVANPSRNMYLIILSESKADFKKEGQDISLQKHSDITRGILVENLTDYKVSTSLNFKIKGNNALEYQIFGITNEKIDIAYIHATVETANNYHQVIAYTSQSQFSKNRLEMQKVINSFQEVK